MLRFCSFSAIFLVSVFISVCQSCQKGYYSWPCKPCPDSTYKDYTGPAGSCNSCPVNSGHQFTGSISRSSCKCNKGYWGDPGNRIRCSIRECPPLNIPRNSAIVGACNRQYSSVCRMKCSEGYEARGSVERQCFEDQNGFMMWTGALLYCIVIRCPVLIVNNAEPSSGSCSTIEMVHQTRCIFTCRSGYQLKGSKERVCQSDKSWSGSTTSCEEIRCPKLTQITGARVYPPECVAGSMRAFSTCVYQCYNGFTVEGDDLANYRNLNCQLDKTWSAKVPKCRDILPPALICPFDMTTSSSKGKTSSFWSVEVEDNSIGVYPDAQITVRSSHVPMQELPIGSNKIYVNATDKAGNVKTCSFFIHVRDTEPPTCSFCPGDIVQEELMATVRVHWKEPICSDNSGNYVTYKANRKNGDLFHVPGTYHVSYDVEDDAGNVNRNCSFKIILKVKSCTQHPPPRNGALACIMVNGYRQCAVLCKTGTDFEFNPPLTYFCGQGQWRYWGYFAPHEKRTPWPNCSAKASHSWIRMNQPQYYFYSGDANDPKVQEAIKVKVHSLLTNPGLLPPVFCLTNKECTKDRISVSPGVIG